MIEKEKIYLPDPLVEAHHGQSLSPGNTVFEVAALCEADLAAVLDVEAEVLATLERPDQLRRNTPDMWRCCLGAPHVALGARVGETLAAVAVLYVPEPGDAEDLSVWLQGCDCRGLRAANYKICMVRSQYRGHGLQQCLGLRLHAEARRRGIALLCSTVSPHNPASIRSLQRLGYRYNRTLAKYGFERALYYKMLSDANR